MGLGCKGYGMKTKFKPGQWESVGAMVRTTRKSNGSGGWLVAECPLSRDSSHADARLMASAPDLYNALHNLLAAIGEESCDDHYPICTQAAIEALAKAGG